MNICSDTKQVKEFRTTYRKKTKHRKRCVRCNRLIQDGEQITARKFVTRKYYPVRGLMAFTNWAFVHSTCDEVPA